jgi:glucose-6-phosphate 1-dehydrogenase
MHHVVHTPRLDTQPVLKRRGLIDHYLGKWPVYNMVFCRFAPAFLEPFRDRNHQQCIQVHAA